MRVYVLKCACPCLTAHPLLRHYVQPLAACTIQVRISYWQLPT